MKTINRGDKEIPLDVKRYIDVMPYCEDEYEVEFDLFQLVETDEDLDQLPTTITDKDMSRSIRNVPSILDYAERLKDHVVYLLCSSDGDSNTTYFIPNRFVEQYPTIEQSIFNYEAMVDQHTQEFGYGLSDD